MTSFCAALGRLTRFLRLRPKGPVVPVIRLAGTIGIGSPLRPGLTAAGTEEAITRAFSRKGIAAVALVINSPGGSPVQSALIARRIRDLAEEKNVKVYGFVEDVAASGGYWLAAAADEIYADAASIIGSIGVVSAGFGFVGALEKLGIERRVHTAGKDKGMLDPFRPERAEDVAKLREVQDDVFAAFSSLVQQRREGRLKAAPEEIFTGAVWAGQRALDLGLIDGLGDLSGTLRRIFGKKLTILKPEDQKGWLARRLGLTRNTGLAPAAAMAEAAVEALEARALWARFGL